MPKMTDDFYIEACKSFESDIGPEKVREYKKSLEYLFKAFVDISKAFDAYKRAIFYGSDIDREKFINAIRRSQSYMNFCVERMRSNETDSEYTDFKVDYRLLHSILGFITETGEIAVQMLDDDSKIDMVNVIEELGDIQWYEAIAVDEIGTTWEDIRQRNYDKLSKRYPNKFTREHAENRDLEAERKALEKAA